MRNQPETLHEYNIPGLHWWFLITSAIFVGCLVLMVWYDYYGDRRWKDYQREFYKWEQKRLDADAKATELRAQEAGLDKIVADLAQADKDIAAKRIEEEKTKAEVESLKVQNDFITREFTMEKALRDQYRSFYEGALERKNLNAEDPEVVEWRDKVEVQNALVDKLDLRKQDADAKLAAAQAKLEAIIGQREKLEKQKKQLEANIILLRKRLDQLTNTLVQAVINAPIIEFAASNIRVEQIVAEDHHVDVNFTTVPRVDRCITCHKAIDRKDLSPDELDWRTKHKVEAVDWSK